MSVELRIIRMENELKSLTRVRDAFKAAGVEILSEAPKKSELWYSNTPVYDRMVGLADAEYIDFVYDGSAGAFEAVFHELLNKNIIPDNI